MSRALSAEAAALLLRIFGYSCREIAGAFGRSKTWVLYWTSPRARKTLLEWGRAKSERRKVAFVRHFDNRPDLDGRAAKLSSEERAARQRARSRRSTLRHAARLEAAERGVTPQEIYQRWGCA